MRRIIYTYMIIVAFCLMTIMTVQAQQPVQSIDFINGSVSMRIDGKFGDWGKLKSPEIELKTRQKVHPSGEDPFGERKYAGERDLSATYRCFADQNHLYIGLRVTDDQAVFGESYVSSGKWWEDDGVEINLTSRPSDTSAQYDRNDSHLAVFSDKDQNLHVIGNIVDLRYLPCLWRAMGLKVGMTRHGKGYNMEIRIPVHVFQKNRFEQGIVFGFNISVIDDDDGNARDYKLCWSNDVNNQSYKNPRVFGRLELHDQIPAEHIQPLQLGKRKAKVQTISGDKVVLQLTGQKKDSTLTAGILQNPERCRQLFKASDDQQKRIALAWCILNNQEQWHESSKEAFLLLKKFAGEIPNLDKKLQERMKNFARLYVNAKKENEIDFITRQSIKLFGTTPTQEGLRYAGNENLRANNYDRAIQFHKKILELEPEPYRKAMAYYDIGFNNMLRLNHNKAIEAFSKSIAIENQLSKPKGSKFIVFSYLRMGRCYISNGDNEKAIATWNELVNKFQNNEGVFSKKKQINIQQVNTKIAEALYQIVRVSLRQSANSQANHYYNILKNKFSDSNYKKRAENLIFRANYFKNNKSLNK